MVNNLSDFRDFLKLGRIYFCTRIYFFNLAVNNIDTQNIKLSISNAIFIPALLSLLVFATVAEYR